MKLIFHFVLKEYLQTECRFVRKQKTEEVFPLD